MAKLVAVFGRILLALIFIASGLDKFRNFDKDSGGPMAGVMAPKLEHFMDIVSKRTNIEIPLHKEHYPYLILSAAFLELVGGALFILDSPVGSVFLMAFLIGATPVMHNFWDIHDSSQIGEMIHFMKNLSILGGLLAYTATRRGVAGKYKED
ncbi:unnamed protein product [Ostreobium quekettii]|uniref:DoxX family protein n=1 Tax=Ostreobium quekettii TaxID=121088 RepID=A0A8S1JF85_9CHLO|nr:unnamed protein product [Ostreobium quekettii]|eukprot:evm.model.scf_607.3 EVM.evm.TU.scf_607.3   scf_607:39799-42106(-)